MQHFILYCLTRCYMASVVDTGWLVDSSATHSGGAAWSQSARGAERPPEQTELAVTRPVGGVPGQSILPHTARQVGATYCLVPAHFVSRHYPKQISWDRGQYCVPEVSSNAKIASDSRTCAIYFVFIAFPNEMQWRAVNSSDGALQLSVEVVLRIIDV
jgi:hypothetical protein